MALITRAINAEEILRSIELPKPLEFYDFGAGQIAARIGDSVDWSAVLVDYGRHDQGLSDGAYYLTFTLPPREEELPGFIQQLLAKWDAQKVPLHINEPIKFQKESQ